MIYENILYQKIKCGEVWLKCFFKKSCYMKKILYNTLFIIIAPILLSELITYYLSGTVIMLITTLMIPISKKKNFGLRLAFNRVI